MPPVKRKPGARVRELRETIARAIDRAEVWPGHAASGGMSPAAWDAARRNGELDETIELELEDAKAIRNALLAMEGMIELGAFGVDAIASLFKTKG